MTKEAKEAPPRSEGKDAHLGLMGALKNRMDQCKAVAKLKFTSISPEKVAVMVVAVGMSRLLIGLGGGMDIFDTDLISGMDGVDSILQGAEHSHIDFTNLPDGDGGSHVVLEQAEPIVTEKPVDEMYGVIKEDGLLNNRPEGFPTDSKANEILNAMHHHSGDGVINFDGSETPPQTETSTELIADNNPVTEVSGAEAVPTPTPTSETVPTPNSPENLSGPQQDIKDLSGPKHPTRILGGEKYTANYPFHK